MKTLAILKSLSTPLVALSLFSMIAAFVLIGCSTSQGLLKPDESVTSFFSNEPLANDYQYYTSSLRGSPVTYLAISKGYDLVSQNWKPVSPQSVNVSSDQVGFSADITGPDNRTIGKLYIANDNYYEHTSVIMLDDKHIQVSIPVLSTSEAALYRLWGIEGTYY